MVNMTQQGVIFKTRDFRWMASTESSFTGAHCNVAANEVHLHVVLVPRKKASCLEATAWHSHWLAANSYDLASQRLINITS
jgi:hypothetical protein